MQNIKTYWKTWTDGSDCEDHPPSCYSGFELEGFGKDYDGYYSSKDESLGIEYYEDSKQVGRKKFLIGS